MGLFFLLIIKEDILKNMGNQTILFDFHIIEKLLWRSVGTINCLVTRILQNIYLCSAEERKIHTRLEQNFFFGELSL